MVGAAEAADLVVVDRAGEIGEQRVVDVDGAPRLHLAHVVDDFGDLVPGGHHREHQGVHRVVGDGERVARVEERTVHQEADVGDPRDVRVDHRVQLAVHLYVEARRGEGVAVSDGVHAAGEGRGEPVRDAAQGPDLGGRVGVQGGAQPPLVEVVGVLVRHQDRVGADRGVLFGEAARVDGERPPVLLQTDAGVRLLGQCQVHGVHGVHGPHPATGGVAFLPESRSGRRRRRRRRRAPRSTRRSA